MRYFLIAFFLFLFQSCLNKDKIPSNVLPLKKMQLVLWDLLRADELIGSKISKDSSLDIKDKSIEMYEQVFRIHNITKNEFQKSVDYYQTRPDLLRVILDSISSQGRNIMARQYNSKPDSIKKQLKSVEK